MVSNPLHQASNRALLVGASSFASRDLPNIRGVRRGVKALADVLCDPQRGVFDRKSCDVVLNPSAPSEFFDPLHRASAGTRDLLLVYYGGHGLLDRNLRLHLAIKKSNPHQPVGNSVIYEEVKEFLERSGASVRVLILDCCFSGQAVGRQSATMKVDDSATAVEQAVGTRTTGMYVL